MILKNKGIKKNIFCIHHISLFHTLLINKHSSIVSQLLLVADAKVVTRVLKSLYNLMLFHTQRFLSFYLFFASILVKKWPASLFSAQAHIDKRGLFSLTVFLFSYRHAWGSSCPQVSSHSSLRHCCFEVASFLARQH